MHFAYICIDFVLGLYYRLGMNSVVQTRIDAKTKKEAELILKRLGLSLNDGIRMFINQVTLNKGIPFQPVIPQVPNEETRKVIEDTENGKNCASFDSVEALFEDLGI